MITKNESRFIQTCLQSVCRIASEIIIVDSGSTDDTLKIAAGFNAKIFSITWQNDYAWARNIAISKCSSDWIFFLDADEYLENAENLLKVLSKAKNRNTGGFLTERTDVYRHKENGLIIHYPVGIVRLFRNNPQFEYRSPVHEQINTAITDAGFTVEILKTSRIIHQVYMSADDFLETKQRRYLGLIENELAKDSTNYWMRYQQAKTYWFLGEKEKAKFIFSGIANTNNCPLVIRCSCFCNKAVLLMEEGLFAEAVNETDKSLQLNPKQSMGMMIKGNIFYQADQFKQSINCYRKVKTSINKLKYNQVIPGDLYVKPEEIKYKIACCYMAMGKTAAAKFLIKRALKINGSHVPSLLLLARIHAIKKEVTIAKTLVAKCLAINPGWKQAENFYAELNAAEA
ncbi:MAG: glycosyltransferase [Ferruginibacter sp.]|nr:glycosyltransferase [Ferruginibacter sp.]